MSKNACFCKICIFQIHGFFGFCNALPAAALNRMFRTLLMLTAKEITIESTVVAETMKLIAKRSSVCQTMDCIRLEQFINSRPFMSLNEFPDQIYQVEKLKTFLFLSSCTLNLQSCKLNTNSSPLSAVQTDMS